MPSSSHDRSRTLSRSIPLVLMAGLALVICAYATVAYVDLRRVLVEHEESRLLSVSELVARLSAQSVQQRLGDLQTLAERPRLLRALSGRDSVTVAAALEVLRSRALQQGDAYIGTEIYGADGTCLLSVSRSAEDGPVEAATGCPRPVPPGDLPPEGLGIGRLDDRNGRVQYSFAVPLAGGRLIEHRMVTSSTATALIAGLIAPDAALVIGNRDGSVGTEGVEALAPGMIAAPTEASLFEVDGSRRIGVGAHVAGTPLAIWVHRDLRAVVAPARQVMINRVLLGIAVLIFGSAGAVLLSRRLTVPLRELTGAADDLRSGQWNRRVESDRQDELGRLAQAFNSMAAALEASHSELERRVAHRTAELQEALDRLAQAQEELLKRERLAVLGQLAGGVAHELRSPLGVMTNSVYYLRAVLTDLPARSADYLDILDRQIEIAKKIISDLLDYARVRPADPKPTPVSPLVTDVLAATIRNGRVDVHRQIHPDTPPALVDSDQIRQVILNIVMNALQAVEETPDPSVTIRVAPSGDGELTVEVEDNGPGIAPEIRQRVFEPLFSTKPKGIGLGLAVSRALALANKGDLDVVEGPGGGALFRLHLPAAAADASPSPLRAAQGVT